MKKKAMCSKCEGRGFYSKFSYTEDGTCNGVSSIVCDRCHSTGSVEVDMSEFDKVKEMALDELAIYLYNFAHLTNKPLNVNDVKKYLEGKAVEGKFGYYPRLQESGEING